MNALKTDVSKITLARILNIPYLTIQKWYCEGMPYHYNSQLQPRFDIAAVLDWREKTKRRGLVISPRRFHQVIA